MKSRNLPLLAGLLMIGILATHDLIKNKTIEDAKIFDKSLIAITSIYDAYIQYGQIEAEITQIAA
jgi:hypothetical protein